MKIVLVIALSLAIPLIVIANEGFSSLEEQMSGKEFSATGLDKLTPEELQALNNWIRSRSVATLDQPKAGSDTVIIETREDARGFENVEKSEKDRSPIATRVKGGFTGWNGHTEFTLENGMIWVQDDKDKFYIQEIQNPEVTIKPGMFGSWHLSVTGHKSSCKVKRIQ